LSSVAYADVSQWKKILDAYEYKWTYTEVETQQNFSLGCIRIRWNAKDWKPALTAQTGFDAKPALDLSSIELDENSEYDEDDVAWEQKFWKGPLVLLHGMQGNADNWLDKYKGPHSVLPLLLADIGYEVWVCNNKGVFDYSSHKTLKPLEDRDYWNYDWETMAD
jgi:pimeloyl-ACP methyl ester carboxylesterase